MINNKWNDFLNQESDKEYFQNLINFINKEYDNKIIYPKKDDIFNAFKLTDLDDLKVVIIGQDPYHEPNQAHGLAFSVLEGVKVPPSLKNIYREIEDEFNCIMIDNGNLSYLAEQGVFLINTVLTVEAHKANSHKNIGWEIFTDNVIKYINSKKKNVVYLLWGAPAISKSKFINAEENYILTSPHPSPLSAYRGFLGNNHFKLCNEYLVNTSQTPIVWHHNFNN